MCIRDSCGPVERIVRLSVEMIQREHLREGPVFVREDRSHQGLAGDPLLSRTRHELVDTAHHPLEDLRRAQRRDAEANKIATLFVQFVENRELEMNVVIPVLGVLAVPGAFVQRA